MRTIRKYLARAIIAAIAVTACIGVNTGTAAATGQSGLCVPTPVGGVVNDVSGALNGMESLMVSLESVNAGLKAGIAGATHSDFPTPMGVGSGTTFQTWTASNGLSSDLALLQQVQQVQQEACTASNQLLSVTQGSPNVGSWSSQGLGGSLATQMQETSPAYAPGIMAGYVYDDAFGEPSLLAAQNAELADPSGQTEALQALGAINSDAVAALQQQNMMQAAQTAAQVTSQMQAANNAMAGFDLNDDPSTGWDI